MKWKKILVKTIFWLTSEIFLSFMGLDYLADYGEFILSRNAVTLSN